MMRIKELPAFPAGNPFRHDLFRMGMDIGSNVIVMYEQHTSERQPYIVICNTETGERVEVVFDDTVRRMSTL